jgi:3-deoxy-D-manno-octulosonic-acid transferase
MRTLYNLLFGVFFFVSAPFYFLKMWRRGSWRQGFGQRFGKYDARIKQRLTNSQVLWFHAVSVGEVNLCTQLIRSIEPRLPTYKILVTTTTSTGMGELNKKLPAHIERMYYPIDRRKVVQKALGLVNPRAVVLIEAELWPNFLWALQRRRIPHFLVNARLSERSFRGYRRFGFLFRKLFASFTGVGAQNETDAARLRDLGFPGDAIEVVGSLKFDSAKLHERKLLDVGLLLSRLGVSSKARVLVAGSTHVGEEAILAEIAERLRKEFPDFFLILVPRHMERGREVGEMLASKGVRYVARSQMTEMTQMEPGSMDCLLVNTTGELRFFYERADLVFVGKSLTAEGGQNPIEPAALGKPVLFGPNMQNFPQIAPEFVKRGGAVQVKDAAELEKALAELLRSPSRCEALGAMAKLVVQENQGSIERTVEMILRHLPANRS